jgi:hypothetical protein
MVIGIQISPNVASYGLICLLVGALCGHAVTPPLAAQKPAPGTGALLNATAADQSQQTETLNVAPEAAVITISGLCDNPPTDKAAASNCKTVINRDEFEKLVDAVQPNMTERARREFAARYADALVMAKRAEQAGMDKGANIEEQMKVARIQILSQEVKKAIQREASQISETDINAYYLDHTSSFEEAEMERIYVPNVQDSPAPSDKTVNDADKQKRLERTGQFMKEVAAKLHARAIAGEDFNILQADAYRSAEIKTTASPSTGKIRRISLPRSQVWVMDLKPGEVSSVIEAPNGYFIYKIKTKETLSLERAREEIKGVLRSRRVQDLTRAIEESATLTLNDIYFQPQRTPQGVNRPASRPEAQ